MTIAEFLIALSTLDTEWMLENSDRWLPCITNNDDLCPIHAVFEALDMDEPDDCDCCVYTHGRLLGLRKRDIKAIMNAADGRVRNRLRSRLLSACGLLEGRSDAK